MLEMSGRAAPVDIAQPVGPDCVSQPVVACALRLQGHSMGFDDIHKGVST